MEKQFTIMVVEDDTNINNLLKTALEKAGYKVLQAFSGTEAELILQMKESISLVLLDLMLPGISGEEVLKHIRDRGNLPVIVLTARDSLDEKIGMLTQGADDYITKPFGMMEFIARVKAVLRRSSRHGDDRELSCEELRIFPGRHQVYCDDQPVELTRKEFELLLYLMENRGIVMTRDQILCHIWGYDFDGETRTVDVHVRTLRQKLGDTGRLIETVRGVGYRMADKGGTQG